MENNKVIDLHPNELENKPACDCIGHEEHTCGCGCGCGEQICTGDCDTYPPIEEEFTNLVTTKLIDSIMSYSDREIELLLAILKNPMQLQAMYPGIDDAGIEELSTAYETFYSKVRESLHEILMKFPGEDSSILGDAMLVLQSLASLNPLSPLSGQPFEWEDVDPETPLFSELKKLCGQSWPEGTETLQHNTRVSSIYRFDNDNDMAFRIDAIIFRTKDGDRISEESILSVDFPYDYRPGEIRIIPDDEELPMEPNQEDLSSMIETE